MKLRSKKNVKPWENIPIDEILPYNPRYTKEIILSYIFIVVFIVDQTYWPQSYNPLLIFAFIGIYGVIAFSFLSLGTNSPKKVLDDFISAVIFFTVILIILDAIKFLITGSGHFKVLMGSDQLITLIVIAISYLQSIFIAIALVLGPLTLWITEHPRTKLHGGLIAVILGITMILIKIFHI